MIVNDTLPSALPTQVILLEVKAVVVNVEFVGMGAVAVW
ncbi:MAG: hypothetical protein TRG1_2291 [Flavobacteriaceae bacterium FS1-H7996/R]|nr:MAG: hypothetical protein TRG1_2291 [Flavobacteriaceae bacterium FS1-H7996/R]